MSGDLKSEWDSAKPDLTAEWESAAKQAPQEMSALDRAKRVAGLGVRAAANYVTAIPTLMAEVVAAPLRAATGGRYFQSPSAVLQQTMTEAGLPEPANKVERFSTAAASGMAGAGGFLSAARAAAPTSMVGQGIRETALQQPAKQIGGAATGAVSSQAAAEAGAGPVGQFLAGTVGGIVPFAPQMVRGRPTPEQTRTNELTVSAQDAGYKTPPSQSNPGVVNSVLEGAVGGKAATERSLSIKNQGVTNRLVKEDLGFPQDRPITAANLEDYRSVQSGPYREVASISQEAAQMLQDLRQARADTTATYRFYNRNQDPRTLREAQALQNTAEGLETQLEQVARNAGRPELIDQLRQARVRLAKSYSIEQALDEATGNVDARILARQFDRNPQLPTSNLNLIGRTANVYGPSMRLPETVGPNPEFSMYDLMLSLGLGGGASAYTGSPYGFLAGAIPMARPVAREALMSPPYQATLGRPNINPLSRQDAAALAALSNLQRPQK